MLLGPRPGAVAVPAMLDPSLTIAAHVSNRVAVTKRRSMRWRSALETPAYLLEYAKMRFVRRGCRARFLSRLELLFRSRLRVGHGLGYLHQLLEFRIAAQRFPSRLDPQPVAEGKPGLMNRTQFSDGCVVSPQQDEYFRL